MKKILALILCIVLFTCTLSVTVSADEVTEDIPSQEEIEDVSDKIVEDVVAWFQNNFEEITVIITLILTIYYNVQKFAKMNKSIGTLNNNAVTVAQNSELSIGSALQALSGISDVVAGYTNEFENLKSTVGQHLNSTTDKLENCCRANIEFANELAELLVLANIPNAKKEELYARHRAAVDAITAVKTENNTEVNGDDEEI